MAVGACVASRPLLLTAARYRSPTGDDARRRRSKRLAVIGVLLAVGVGSALFPTFVGSGRHRSLEAPSGSLTVPGWPPRTALRGLNLEAAMAPRRGEDEEEDEMEALMQELEEEFEDQDMEDDEEEDNYPIITRWSKLFRRLQQTFVRPGHLVVRRWLKRGKKQGYVTLAFPAPARQVVREPEVNVCLVSRRDIPQKVTSAWSEQLETAPLFDFSIDVRAPVDISPVDPPWDWPLDDLPADYEIREALRDEELIPDLCERWKLTPEELAEYADRREECCRLLRSVVAKMPEELLDQTELVRLTVKEMIRLLWVVHGAAEAPRLRLRFACSDSSADGRDRDEDTVPEGAFRTYFIVAGEGLEFVPSPFVDPDREAIGLQLPGNIALGMDSDEWARSVAIDGANASQVLKRVPEGWVAMLKGEDWRGSENRPATYRLPKRGKRVFMQVDVLQDDGVDEDQGPVSQPAESKVDEPKATVTALRTLRPVGGVLGLLVAWLTKTAVFQLGRKAGKDFRAALRGIQRVPEPIAPEAAAALQSMDELPLMDYPTSDEAPVVLVIGGRTPTGKVISQKLVMRGFHVVFLLPHGKGARVERMERVMSQGAVVGSTRADLASLSTTNLTYGNIIEEVYDAVVGVDKVVVCACDPVGEEDSNAITGIALKNILSCWQIYRMDFCDWQSDKYSTSFRLFDLTREIDCQLWATEQSRISDLAFGQHRSIWTPQGKEGFVVGLWWATFMAPQGQAMLKSPTVDLNFSRFSGLLLKCYNGLMPNRYYFFLRTSDFEETRVQYEFEFNCESCRGYIVRMPFKGFKPVRVDGVELSPEAVAAMPLRRDDVRQMGIVFRTDAENPREPALDSYGVFRGQWLKLFLSSVKAYRTQQEPQVVMLGREASFEEGGKDDWLEDFDGDDLDEFDELEEKYLQAERQAEAEIEELVGSDEIEGVEEDEEPMEFGDPVQNPPRPRSPLQSLAETGLAYTVIKVKGLNEHPGGKYPILVEQASHQHVPHSKLPMDDLGYISRGDAAELAVSALTEGSCVNVVMRAGEVPSEAGARGAKDDETAASSSQAEADPQSSLLPSFRLPSTMTSNVKEYMKRMQANN